MTASKVPAESLQEQLSRARTEAAGNTIERLAIPGYGGGLVGCYHMLGWKEQRRIATRNAKMAGKTRDDKEAQADLNNAADTLVACCEKVEVRVPKDADEHMHAQAEKFNQQDYKLNTALAEYLGLHDAASDPISDREAVFLIIPKDIQVVAHAGKLMERQGFIDEELNEELLGEAEAAS
jgi:hypothetical protein